MKNRSAHDRYWFIWYLLEFTPLHVHCNTTKFVSISKTCQFLYYNLFERTHLYDTELNATRAYNVIINFHCFKQSHVIVFKIRQGLKYIICLFRFQRDSFSRIMLLNKKDNHYMLEYADAYMHMKFCKIENKKKKLFKDSIFFQNLISRSIEQCNTFSGFMISNSYIGLLLI